MSTLTNPKIAWETYCAQEIALLHPILKGRGYSLDTIQPHIAGERYLMHAVTTTSGKKLILLGSDALGTRVVIKATRDAEGEAELMHERTCRTLLTEMDFAGEVFHTPREVAFICEGGFVISIQLFIEQACTFLERPLAEQFNFALSAFKGQESAHATTSKHRARVAGVFGIRNATTYLHAFATFCANIKIALPNNKHLHALIDEADGVLRREQPVIEQYTGFLTHTDFVPHNIRIYENTMYLLDYSSLIFGNKYEGWARFINFMTLYNPELEEALITYVRNNRTPEESLALRMMRVYRLGQIIWYYVQTLDKSTDNLKILNTARVEFWSAVLSHVLKDERTPSHVIHTYIQTRDTLRSDDEKRRQQGLH